MSQTVLEKVALVAMGVVLMGAALFTSCAGPKKIDPVAPTPEIKAIGIDVGNAGKTLKGTTDTIRTNATDGMKLTPPAAAPVLNPKWTSILTAVGVQDQLVTNLAATKERADKAEASSGKFEADFKTEHEARLKAEDNTAKQLRQKYLGYSGILFFISLICGGVAIFAGGNKIAMYGGILAGVGSAVCITIVQVAPLIPWIIGGLALIATGLLVYSYIKKNGQITLFHTATKELVQTIESAKPKMTMGGRAAVFGDGPSMGDAHVIQSKSTIALVKEIRADGNTQLAPALPATIAQDWNGDGIIDARDVPPTMMAISPPIELVSPNRPVGLSRKRVLS